MFNRLLLYLEIEITILSILWDWSLDGIHYL